MANRGLVRVAAATFTLALSAARPHAQVLTWTIDPGHSSVQFSVRHMLITTARGEFDGATGTVRFDPANLAGTLQVEAAIDARTINTHNAARDRDLKSADFFDVERYPTVTFKSKRATPGADGHINLVGDLTMRGITREVTLDMEPPSPVVTDSAGTLRMGTSATATIDRREFGMRYNELLETGAAVVSNEVRITLDIQVRRAP